MGSEMCIRDSPLYADQDPAEAAEQAAALGEVGVEVVIFTMRNPYSAATVEALGKVLATA